jgi:hypothetical protein
LEESKIKIKYRVFTSGYSHPDVTNKGHQSLCPKEPVGDKQNISAPCNFLRVELGAFKGTSVFSGAISHGSCGKKMI